MDPKHEEKNEAKSGNGRGNIAHTEDVHLMSPDRDKDVTNMASKHQDEFLEMLENMKEYDESLFSIFLSGLREGGRLFPFQDDDETSCHSDEVAFQDYLSDDIRKLQSLDTKENVRMHSEEFSPGESSTDVPGTSEESLGRTGFGSKLKNYSSSELSQVQSLETKERMETHSEELSSCEGSSAVSAEYPLGGIWFESKLESYSSIFRDYLPPPTHIQSTYQILQYNYKAAEEERILEECEKRIEKKMKEERKKNRKINRTKTCSLEK